MSRDDYVRKRTEVGERPRTDDEKLAEVHAIARERVLAERRVKDAAGTDRARVAYKSHTQVSHTLLTHKSHTQVSHTSLTHKSHTQVSHKSHTSFSPHLSRGVFLPHILAILGSHVTIQARTLWAQPSSPTAAW